MPRNWRTVHTKYSDTVLYLTRWEWQRAITSGVLLPVVEVFLATVVPLTRLSRLEQRMERSDARVEEVRQRLQQSRAPHPHRFRWMGSARVQDLDGTQHAFVFVPVPMAAGAALSGIARVIHKVAGATARPGAERRLAGRLTALTAPPCRPPAPGTPSPVPGRPPSASRRLRCRAPGRPPRISGRPAVAPPPRATTTRR